MYFDVMRVKSSPGGRKSSKMQRYVYERYLRAFDKKYYCWLTSRQYFWNRFMRKELCNIMYLYGFTSD